jgi:hypothetical protein
VLPQTQGARFIYEEHIHPRLEEHETAIEEFIASAHARLRSAGIAYLKRAIELLKTNVLGLPPSPEPAAAPEPQTPQSYTQSLLARFTLPSPRWNTTLQGTNAATATTTPTDFYTLLTSTLSAAAGAATAASPTSILPEAIRSSGAAARVSFIQAQRERLRAVMSALDREEAAATVLEQQTQAQQAQDRDGGNNGGGGFDKRRSLSEQSIGSGLSKSRSEGDFEKLDAPSGGEEMEGEDGVVRRRGAGQQATTPAAAGGGRGGGWMPWGWGGGGGGGGGEDVGRSSGMEK